MTTPGPPAAAPDGAATDGAAPKGGVMHVITGLQTGGAERMLVNYLTHPSRASAPASVVALTGTGGFAETLRASGLPVIELALPRRARSLLPGAIRLARLIRAGRPATVAAWMYHADLMAWAALALSGRRGRTRLVWHIRCSAMDVRRYPGGFARVVRACRRLAGRADAVVYNSHRGRADHHRLGFPDAGSLVLANGIDTGRFRPDGEKRQAMRRALGLPDSAPVVIAVARYDPMKGYDVLREALARLRRPEVVCLVAGLGTDRHLPAEHGLRPLGERADIPALMAAADVFVSSSRFGEGFSNVLAEAMACGLVPVATDVGDAARIVGETGWIVPPDDPAALADAIAAAVDRVGTTGPGPGLQARQRIASCFALADSVAALDRVHGVAGDPAGQSA
jgi:glycosyltransferase involved in cell wall biosynthesis